jgi:hypothetical protein
MRFITKLLIILFMGVIAVVLLNLLINVNADTSQIQSDSTTDQSVSAIPTLLAPVQESDLDTANNQNYNCLLYLLGLIGVIGVMVIGINNVKRNR